MQFYFNQIPRLLTLTLMAYLAASALAGFARRRASRVDAPGREAWGAVAWFATVGSLGALVLHPMVQPFGVAHAAMFPSAVALALGAWVVLSRGRGRAVRTTVAGLCLEFLLAYWIYIAFVCLVLPGLPRDAFAYANLKDGYHLIFLRDFLGQSASWATIGCGLALLRFSGLLFRWSWDRAEGE